MLEVHEPPESQPRILCGRAIAEILVREHDAEHIDERVIRMLRGNAHVAIRQAREIGKKEKSTSRLGAPRPLFLFCAGCHERMTLPVPTPGKITEGQLALPPEKWRAEILHLGCGAVFAYSALELRVQWSDRTRDRNRNRLPRWRCVKFSCVEQHCKAPANIFVCLTSAISKDKLISTIFDEVPRVWRCPAGHPVIYGKAQQEEVSSLE